MTKPRSQGPNLELSFGISFPRITETPKWKSDSVDKEEVDFRKVTTNALDKSTSSLLGRIFH